MVWQVMLNIERSFRFSKAIPWVFFYPENGFFKAKIMKVAASEAGIEISSIALLIF
jgi:hypothetical protein